MGSAQGLYQPQWQAVLITPRDQGHTRVGAERGIGIGLGKAHAFRRQLIERRCGIAGLAGAAEIGIAAIIDDN